MTLITFLCFGKQSFFHIYDEGYFFSLSSDSCLIIRFLTLPHFSCDVSDGTFSQFLYTAIFIYFLWPVSRFFVFFFKYFLSAFFVFFFLSGYKNLSLNVYYLIFLYLFFHDLTSSYQSLPWRPPSLSKCTNSFSFTLN